MELESMNFNDQEFKDQILKDEGLSETNFSDAEIIDDNFDLKSLVKNAPQVPKTAKNIIMDASAIAKNERDRVSKEMNLAINSVFSQYNQKYGLELNLNLNSLSETLINVSTPEKRKLLELYVSEVFKSVKPILLLHMLQRLVILMDYVLQPQNLMDTSQLSLPDQFLIVEKIQSWIVSLTDIIDSDAVIKDSDAVLKKLAEENNDETLDNEESRKAVESFMELFRKESIENKNK